MERVSQDSIKALLHQNETAVVSIYFPTYNPETLQGKYQDQTEFKNLISKVKQQIIEHTFSKTYAQSLIAALTSIWNSPETWQETTRSMAIFVNESRHWVFSLPIMSQQRITVARSFSIAPLLALLSYDQSYFLLALAVHEPRIYKGSMYGLEPVAIDLPESPAEALHIDELFSNSNTLRRPETTKASHSKMSFQSQGNPQEAGAEERLQYFRAIDEMLLSSKSFDATLPVVIAGTSSEIAEYRSITKLHQLLDSHIEGNRTKATLDELHTLSWPHIEHDIKRIRRMNLISRYNDLVGSHQASSDMAEIRSAADGARVEILLLAMRKPVVVETSDTESEDTEQALSSQIIFPSDYDEQELNRTAIAVVSNGGFVVGIDPTEMPDHTSMAAIYRY